MIVGPIRIVTSVGTLYVAIGEGLVFGRDASCDVVIDDPLVSRHHLHILVTNDSVVLEDLKSRNGVYVNCVRIDESTRLNAGDRMLLGSAELSVFSDEPPGRPM